MTIPTDWPEPGGRPPAPSAELHRIQDFVNTNDVEAGRDAIGTPQLLHAWLVAAGAVDAGSRVTRDAHDRALAVREGRAPLVTGEEYRKVTRVLNLIYERARVGPFAKNAASA